jgi:putative SOS response-associated peptidase YedK
MCGRMTQRTPPSSIAAIFDADLRDDEPFEPRYNVAPTDPLVVVVQRDDGRVVERHRWGLIPSWAPTAANGARLINARAETVADSPAFRAAFRARRCIIPSDGFYEWRRDGTRRQPYLLAPPPGAVLAMAGLWSLWKDPATGFWVPSAAVVTTAANADVSFVHDRMPVLLPRDAWRAWLDPAERDTALLRSMLVPAPDGALDIRAVSTRVNSVRNDGPDLIVPLGGPPDGGAPLDLPQPTLFD